MQTKTDAIEAFIQPHLLALQPYSSARSEFKGQAAVFLDANEHPVESGLNRYPDPLQEQLKRVLAAKKGLSPKQIFLGNGSDEAIDLLIRLFCRPGIDEILVLPPTYGMYQVAAAISNVQVREIRLTPDFQPDVPAILQQCRPETKLLFLCSPNNPTGNLFDRRHMVDLLEHFPGLIVLDEAYIDYAEEEGWLSLLDQYPSLIILQTFSKAWGLAGIRVGMAFAQPAIIQWLNRIKPPYNINVQSQQVALQALQSPERLPPPTFWQQERERLKQGLSALQSVQQIFPSSANFLLVRFADPDGIYTRLVQAGIIVRNRSRLPLCAGCLRITIGTATENDQLLNILQKLDT